MGPLAILIVPWQEEGSINITLKSLLLFLRLKNSCSKIDVHFSGQRWMMLDILAWLLMMLARIEEETAILYSFIWNTDISKKRKLTAAAAMCLDL